MTFEAVRFDMAAVVNGAGSRRKPKTTDDNTMSTGLSNDPAISFSAIKRCRPQDIGIAELM